MCATNNDCAGFGSGPICNAATSQCGCSTSSDCGDAYRPACLPSGACGCATDTDCASSPEGGTCMQGGYCGCASATDCTTAITGRVCNSGNSLSGACGCSTSADCATGLVCVAYGGYFPNGAQCQAPCKTNADCPASLNGVKTICDTTTGICGECNTSADCASDAFGHTCVPGTTNGDQFNACRCEANAECATSVDGAVCNGTSTLPGKCGCSSNADCPSGHVCDPIQQACEAACTTDASCQSLDVLTPFCATSGLCVSCLTAADCKGSATGPLCGSLGQCVTCNSDSDCSADPNGPTCVTGAYEGYCSCSVASDCTNSVFGVQCNGICGCNAATDCTNSTLGHACGASGQCGCASTTDCPAGKTCNTTYGQCL